MDCFCADYWQIKKIEDFRTNLQAIKYGFDKTKALEALTTVPASLLGKVTKLEV
jgi:hypothetical protein